ncbi:MAG: helix-turn-helix transcriptional regulator, partial [Clostridia bacterium]|nr:helix-turn-helix transcriptional regulator [Clostridia bacterium]
MENTFASALREVRKRRRLRQEDLARMLGVGRPTIANWERGAKL